MCLVSAIAEIRVASRPTSQQKTKGLQRSRQEFSEKVVVEWEKLLSEVKILLWLDIQNKCYQNILNL